MELLRAQEILATLADGMDPFSGEFLPPNNIYQQPDVIRALYIALKALDGDCSKKLQRKLPDNAGTPWSKEQEAVLISYHTQGVPIKEIAIQMQRTNGSIKARMEKLGLISE